MSSEQQRQALEQRISGVFPDASPDSLKTIGEAYIAVHGAGWHYHTIDFGDDTFASAVQSAVRNIQAASPAAQSDEPGADFFRYLQLEKNMSPADWRAAHPTRKLGLANEFEASQTTAPTEDEKALAALRVRYGTDLDAAFTGMKPYDKMIFAGARKGVSDHQRHAANPDGSTLTKLSHNPVLATLSPQRKLEFANSKSAVLALTHEINALRKPTSTDYRVETDRSQRIAIKEAERQRIVDRFPAGLFKID